MSEATPKSFEDIDPDVLRRQAVEDWAVEVKPSDSLKKVVAALEEGGVFWEDYAARYGYDVPPQVNTLDEPDSVENVGGESAQYDPAATNSGTLTPEWDVNQRTPEPTRAEKPVMDRPTAKPLPPRAAAPLQVVDDRPYLVKMERPNVRYQVGKYTFTQSHPYALVDPKDLEFVLTHEPGFRQAMPSEVAEFYS